MNNILSYRNFVKKIEKDFLFEKKPSIAVAVSGGPDSIALVFLVNQWIKKKKGHLIAITIDHQIRKYSYNEAQQTKKYLNKNKIKTILLKIPKNKVINKKMNEARVNRFNKIINYCKKNNIFHVFLGHHADDNFETFVLRKIAGSNLEGLNSIKEKTILNNVQILRPLLNFSKEHILDFNKKMKLEFIEDPSNSNDKYSRVYIRNFIKLNYRNMNEAKNEFSFVRNNYYDYQKMIFQVLNLISLEFNKNNIVIDLKKFLQLENILQAKIIEIIYKYFKLNKSFLRYNKISNFLDNLSKNTNIKVNLGSLKINAVNNYIYFSL